MDNSTKDVNLLTAFILDIINEVEKLDVDMKPLLAIADGYSLSNPYDLVPIDLYNSMCEWVEKHLGGEVIRAIGQKVGNTAFGSLVENGIIVDGATPAEIMDGLVIAAASMIQDPKERGWEILEEQENLIIMRRTQTFNSQLQFGLLKGLAEKCLSIKSVDVQYRTQVALGDPFDEYVVSWENTPVSA